MIKKILCLICCFLLSMIFVSNVWAINTDFETTVNDGAEASRKRRYLSLKEDEVTKDKIFKGVLTSFDVSESGKIVLCLENHRLVIMDTNGEVLREFSYDGERKTYACWKGENILLYWGDALIEITQDGDLVSMKELIYNYHNTKLMNDWERTLKIETMDCVYQIKNKSLFMNPLTNMTYSQLVKIDAEGNEITLYDAHNTQFLKILIEAFFVIAFIITFLVMFFKAYKRMKNMSIDYGKNK